ncbi:hypothetical protein [Bradyrhizobium sp. CCBAU 45389]|uniref:hypothetical protein n=1 Tax=Bradyrhizobium sp. CCBAU 45389 TaxID=858429 RepID=UPI0023064924|nr:hypothetical protein [Bradyrhizobium sp. CCBAU 45389]MDA9400778.1 hypothetical protein [Bradyrhizobium sp. CCBAU 45389]
MLTRAPSRRRQRNAKRERNRLAKIRQRARELKHIKLYLIKAGEVVHEGLRLRNIDAGMTPDEAEKAARNKKRVRADLETIVAQWALKYQRERGRG